LADGTLDKAKAWIGQPPEFDATPKTMPLASMYAYAEGRLPRWF
jgi:hypothetical protein